MWRAIDRQWRYGVRSAARQGVVVEQTLNRGDIERFFALCEAIGQRKEFDVSGSEALLSALLSTRDGGVEARLFVARYHEGLAAGAVVLRCGRTLHYFWGAVDRAYAKQRAGEAVHGAIIDWAIEQGIERYDLEGIDPAANPGTYAFKMKMGAREVVLPGRRAYPLTIAGRAAITAGRLLGKL